MTNIGFIGTGTMGAPMAGHLVDGGHAVRAFDVMGVPQALKDKGVTEVGSCGEAAAQAEVVIIMVPDTPDVEAVLFGDAGVADAVSPGTIIVDMSSISPLATKDFARKIEELGCHYLDAPVSGGDVRAVAGTLSIMVGGEPKAFEAVMPLFELMGEKITLIGGNGDGQTCKVANQIIIALNLEAVAEALLFASKAGADPVKVREALLGGAAYSPILELHGERMIERDFAPRFRVELHQKDLNLALSGARAMGMSLPNTATTQELFNACAAQGDGKNDHTTLLKVLERLANHEIA